MAKDTKDNYGRPTAVTPEVLRKLEEAFSLGCSDREACLYANIAPSTLYLYQQKNPEFSERKADLKDKPVLLARQVVIKAIQGDKKNNILPDHDLAFKYLERKKRKEFALRTQMELKQVEAFDDMTDEQLAEIANGANEALGAEE